MIRSVTLRPTDATPAWARCIVRFSDSFGNTLTSQAFASVAACERFSMAMMKAWPTPTVLHFSNMSTPAAWALVYYRPISDSGNRWACLYSIDAGGVVAKDHRPSTAAPIIGASSGRRYY